jgi:hypothetical protein
MRFRQRPESVRFVVRANSIARFDKFSERSMSACGQVSRRHRVPLRSMQVRDCAETRRTPEWNALRARRNAEACTYELDDDIDYFTNPRFRATRNVFIPVTLRIPVATSRNRYSESTTTKHPKMTHTTVRPSCCTLNLQAAHQSNFGKSRNPGTDQAVQDSC